MIYRAQSGQERKLLNREERTETEANNVGKQKQRIVYKMNKKKHTKAGTRCRTR